MSDGSTREMKIGPLDSMGKAMSTERCPTCGSNDRRFKWDQYDPDVAQPCHDPWHAEPAPFVEPVGAELKKFWPNCEHPDKVVEFAAHVTDSLRAEIKKLKEKYER